MLALAGKDHEDIQEGEEGCGDGTGSRKQCKKKVRKFLSMMSKLILSFFSRINGEFFPEIEQKTNCQMHCHCSDEDIIDSEKIDDIPRLEDIIREELLRSKQKKQAQACTKKGLVLSVIFKSNPYCIVSSIAITHVNDEDDSKCMVIKEKSSKATKVPTVFSCWMCKKPGKGMLKCSVCRKARYCGETCQWEDWGRHRKFCKIEGMKREEREKRKKKRKSTGVEEEVD